MFLSMISSRKITEIPAFSFPSSGGITTTLGRPLGTRTIAKSSSESPFFFFTRAAIFRDLLRISGKGREESTAIGVSTG